jgi:hypothetical protein
MVDPVVATDGHTYEREYIERHVLVNKNIRSPMYNSNDKNLLPFFIINYNLRSQIKEFITHHQEHQEEYNTLKEQADAWMDERKKHLPKRIIDVIQNDESNLLSLFYKKGDTFAEIVDFYRIDPFRYDNATFWEWLNNAHQNHTLNTQQFIHAIDKGVVLQSFFHYDAQFKLLSQWSSNILLAIKPYILSRWLPIAYQSTKIDKRFSLHYSLEQLNMQLMDIEKWDANEEALLADLMGYSISVKQLIKNGNFSTPKSNEVSISALEQLKVLKIFNADFRKQLFGTRWKAFRSLVYKNNASIPWYKWINFWKAEQQHKTNGIKFADILADHDEFSGFVENIRKKWFYGDVKQQSGANCKLMDEFKQDEQDDHKEVVTQSSINNRKIDITSKTLNDAFDQTVEICELWEFYNNLNEDCGKLFFNDGKKALIHQWLTTGQLTVKQLMEMLSNQAYKKKYGNYIIASGTEALECRLLHFQWNVLKQSSKKREFYLKKTTEVFNKLLKKIGFYDKNPFKINETKTAIVIVFKEVEYYKALQRVLNLDTSEAARLLTSNQSQLSISVQRATVDSCLKYIDDTGEALDEATCKKIYTDSYESSSGVINQGSLFSVYSNTPEKTTTQLNNPDGSQVDRILSETNQISRQPFAKNSTHQSSQVILGVIQDYKIEILSSILIVGGAVMSGCGVYQCIQHCYSAQGTKFSTANPTINIDDRISIL